MKNFAFLLFVILFVACGTASRIVENNDTYLNVDRMKLAFNNPVISQEKFGRMKISQIFNLNSTYFTEIEKDEKPELTLKFEMTTPISVDELDSTVFLILDEEPIKLQSKDYDYKEYVSTSTTVETPTTSDKKSNEKSGSTTETRTTITNGTNQLMSRTFVIPENLWVPIANSKHISYRIYLGKDAYDARLTASECKKLNYYFELAICKRDANKPAPPANEKKL